MNSAQAIESRQCKALAPTPPILQAATIVVKLGGSALKTTEALEKIVDQIATLALAGEHVVVVHGGGPHISRAMEADNEKPVFANGLRVTDDAALMTVFSALGTINAALVKSLRQRNVACAGLHADPLLFSCVKAPPVVVDGKLIDLGWVGKIASVNVDSLNPFNTCTTVVSPIGWDQYRNRYNLNADHAAMALAVALGAGTLVFLSDVPGVLTDISDPESRVPMLNENHARALMDGGIVSGGMLPKIASSLSALKAGVGRVCLVDGRQDAALLDVLNNSGAAGTTICA